MKKIGTISIILVAALLMGGSTKSQSTFQIKIGADPTLAKKSDLDNYTIYTDYKRNIDSLFARIMRLENGTATTGGGGSTGGSTGGGATTPPATVTYTPINKLLVDFGTSGFQTTWKGWNNLNDGTSLSTRMLDSTGSLTNYTITIPSSPVWDNKGSASGLYGDLPSEDFVAYNNNADIHVTGLDTSLRYSATFYVSRMDSTNVSRSTVYTVNGQSVTLEPTNNVNNFVYLYPLKPDSTGNITISLTKGASNTAGKVYLSVLDMDVYAPSGRFVSIGHHYIDFGTSGNLTTGYTNLAGDIMDFNSGKTTPINNLPKSRGLSVTWPFFVDGGTFLTYGPSSSQNLTPYANSAVIDGFFRRSAYDLTFNGMDTAKLYDISVYAGVGDAPDQTRGASYTINGSTQYMDATNNFSTVLKFANIKPDATGHVVMHNDLFGSNVRGDIVVSVIDINVKAKY